MKLIALTITIFSLSMPAWAADAKKGKSSHHHDNAKAHVHGEAKLNIVISKKDAVVNFETPGDNIYGFEHEPKTPAEKTKFAEQNKKLAQVAAQLITFTPDPKCQPKVAIETPHAEDHKEEHKGEHKEEEHSDVHVNLTYKCAQDLEPLTVTVNVKKHFPGVKKLSANVVTSQKQYATSITTDSQNLKP